jgi:hypothetical protein
MIPLSVILLLILAAFICAVASAAGKCPLWVSVILVIIVELLRVLPVGR